MNAGIQRYDKFVIAQSHYLYNLYETIETIVLSRFDVCLIVRGLF